MKVILFLPDVYSLTEMFVSGFRNVGWDVQLYNYKDQLPRWKVKMNTQTFRLPHRMRKIWDNNYLKKINYDYLKTIRSEKPDLVLVYNHQMLLPETARELKKICKLAFFLGDNPYYIFNIPFYLTLLFEADYIMCPDSFWLEQLRLIGIRNIHHDVLGYSKNLNYIREVTEEERVRFGHDVVFIGSCYKDTWGFKRALYLNQFARLDLRIFGNSAWARWFGSFPGLREKIEIMDERMSFDLLNTICNCCKVYPVESNPGLIHGTHLRIFECIGSGILPIVDYRKDVDILFRDIDIPVVKDYRSAYEIASFYIEHDNERRELVSNLRKYVENKFQPEHAIERLISGLFS
ncbi:MAG: glycosyltransferase [Bacteroidales bacterium]|nr:glycosyltransferase [Bacteroidales bacterium]